MTKKRGALSTDEQQFILNNRNDMKISEMAEKLNRNTAPIKRFLIETASVTYKELGDNEITDVELRNKLHEKHYWAEIVAQFGFIGDNSEIKYFEDQWVALMKQFNLDVLISEEMDIIQLITFTILMNRIMKERKQNMEDVNKLKKYIRREQSQPKEERDFDKLNRWEDALQYAKTALSNFGNEHTKLFAQIDNLSKRLKAARSDRIKNIESTKKTFIDLLKSFEEEEVRVKAGLEAEIMARAADKARLKYYEEHRYEDGIFDRPILNSESILLDEGKHEEEITD